MFTDEELSTIEFCLNLAHSCLDRDEFEYATQIDEVEELLERVRKMQMVLRCPKCNAKQEYYPNPYYIHICSECKEQYTESDLIRR